MAVIEDIQSVIKIVKLPFVDDSLEKFLCGIILDQ